MKTNIFRISFFICICLLTLGQNYAQQNSFLYINTDEFRITGKAILSVNGNLVVNTDGNIDNGYKIYINDSIINQSPALFMPSSYGRIANDGSMDSVTNIGYVYFNGISSQKIINDSIIIFDTAIVNNQNNVLFKDDVNIVGEMTFVIGNFDLNGNKLFLQFTGTAGPRRLGTLGQESNTSRIVDGADTGYIEAEKELTDGGAGSFKSIGIDPNANLGIARFKRFHTSDTLVTNGSILKWFELDTSANSGQSAQTTIYYIDNADLLPRMHQDSLWIWYFAPVSHQYSNYGTNYTDFEHIFYPSETENTADTVLNQVTGEVPVSKDYRYTLAEINCNENPAIEIGDTIEACPHEQLRLFPFPEGVDWRNHFYKWGSSVPVKRQVMDNTTYEFVFNSDSIPLGQYIKIWVDVRNVKGCHSSDTAWILVHDGSEMGLKMYDPAMNPSQFIICPGQSFYIRDTANTDDEDFNYTWMFPGDTIRNSANTVFHQLDNPGNIPFSVEYTNQYGCIVRKDKMILVSPLPVPDITTDLPICLGAHKIIENRSQIQSGSSITTYTWKFNGADSIVVRPGSIVPPNNGDHSSEPMGMSNLNPDLTYHFNQAGAFQVVLIAKSNALCIAADTLEVYVNSAVIADFDVSGASEVCSGIPSVLAPGDSSTTGPGINYSWNVGSDLPWIDGETVTYTFPESGNFKLFLAVVSDSGCADTITESINIRPHAMAVFNAPDVCLGQNTVFDNTSTQATSWQWNYANGVSETIFENSIQYDSAGSYQVRLVANNQWNCPDTLIKEIEVFPLPVLDFEIAEDACVNDQDNIISNNAQAGIIYHWNFGDGTVSSESQPSKIYGTAGTYNIGLIGTDLHECSSTQSDQIVIHDIINAGFNPSLASVCRGVSSQFSPLTILGGLQSIRWDFGNGNSELAPSTAPDINYTYPESGMFTVSMITISNYNCTDTAMAEVIIFPNPDAEIITDGQLCTGSEIVFRVNDSPSIENIINYSWNFGDLAHASSNFSQSPVSSHFYADQGNYQVVVQVQSDQGCQAYDTLDMVVNAIPVTPFDEQSSTCLNTLELVAGPANLNYAWSDGSSSNSLLVTQNGLYSVTISDPVTLCSSFDETYVELLAEVNPHLGDDISACDYAILDAHNPGARSYSWLPTMQTSRLITVNQSGIYTVQVEDINGCQGYDTIEVTINPAPQINLPATISACQGEILTIDPGVTVGTFLWNTGSNNPSITTTEPGYYWVNVTTTGGCSDDALTSVVFNPVPIVSLGQDIVICADKSILLSAGNPGSNYLWSGGQTTQAIVPLFTGNYSVDVTNSYGCTGSDQVYVQINTLPEIDLGGTQSLCEGNTLILDAGVASTYYWSTNQTSQAISVSNPGLYWVRITDANRCTSLSPSIEVTFREVPVMPFHGATLAECNYVLLDAGNPGATYLWNDGNTGRNNYITESGTYWVQVTNDENCSINDTVDIIIRPMANVDLPSTLALCKGSRDFIDAGWFGNDYSYNWNTGSTEQYIPVTGPGTYKVQVVHSEGCVSEDSTIVSIKNTPVVNLDNEVIMCANSGLTIDAGNPGSFYSWGSSNGLSYSGRELVLQDTGVYWVHVLSQNGCSTDDTIRVLFTGQSIYPFFMVASRIRVGDTVKFVDLSVPVPSGYLWEFGDMLFSEEMNPEHIYYSQDTFNARLTVSNEVCSASITKPITVSGYNPDYLIKLARENNHDLPGLIMITESKVYPNPAGDYVILKLELSNPADIAVYLYSMNGQIIEMNQFDGVENLEHTINLSSLYSGMYFIRVVTRNDAKTFKVLKIR